MLTAVAKPAGLVQVHRLAFVLVPSARLELAQLSPLPPQDSVSTNFTTTADVACLDGMRNREGFGFPNNPEFYPGKPSIGIRVANLVQIIWMESGQHQKLERRGQQALHPQHFQRQG